MPTNGHRTKTDAEPTEYQKKIGAMDNVILCVAEAERLIDIIGRDLIVEPPEIPKPTCRRKPDKKPWSDRRNFFKP